MPPLYDMPMPPDIAVTKPVPGISRPFWDDNSLINSASMGQIFTAAPAVHYVEAPQPCEALFKLWAEYSPEELLSAMSSGVLEPHDLTFAAEAAGRIADATRAIPALLALLDHTSPLVREGAIYGLAPHADDPSVAARLLAVSNNDPSAAVRVAAHESIE